MRGFAIPFLCAGLLFASAGCREEGAAEKAGRAVDEAVDRLRYGDEGTLEKLGREIDEQLDDASRAARNTADRAAGAIEENVDAAREALADAVEGDDEG